MNAKIELLLYVLNHLDPAEEGEEGVIDMVLLQAKPLGQPTIEEFKPLLLQAIEEGEHQFDPFDSEEHSYQEFSASFGGGDSASILALLVMALGSHLDMWRISSPKTMLDVNMIPAPIRKEVCLELAKKGLVTASTGEPPEPPELKITFVDGSNLSIH